MCDHEILERESEVWSDTKLVKIMQNVEQIREYQW